MKNLTYASLAVVLLASVSLYAQYGMDGDPTGSEGTMHHMRMGTMHHMKGMPTGEEGRMRHMRMGEEGKMMHHMRMGEEGKMGHMGMAGSESEGQGGSVGDYEDYERTYGDY